MLSYFYDQIIKGGFPPGSMIIIAGEPGTGKTILASTIVYEELKKGKKAMYVSLNEPKEDYLSSLEKFGIKFSEENFKFVDLFTVSKEALVAQIELIVKEFMEFKPDILVIDSITAITSVMNPEYVRSFLHTSLGRLVKSTGAIALLIAEKPMEHEGLGFGVEEFVVDGVIILRYIKCGEHYRRVLEIPKMRKRKIKKPQYEYAITEKGIVFFDIPELERFEELTFERVTTGIEKLDELMDGGFYRGSITIIAGHTGSGKTTFGLFFTYANALKGNKAMFITFEESVSNVLRAMKNYGMDYDKVKDKLIIKSLIPEAQSPVSFFVEIKDLIESEKPIALFIDSFSSLHEHMDKAELDKMVRYLQITVKKYGIALCSTINIKNGFNELPTTGLSTLADNIILLTYDIVDNKLTRKLLVLKARASNHSRKVYTFEISSRGVEIYD